MNTNKSKSIRIYKYIVIAAAILLIIVIILITGSNSGSIKVPMSSEQIIGRNQSTVEAELKDAGFRDIVSEEIRDLTPDQSRESGTVTEISIQGQSSFNARQRFDKDSVVRITYHSLSVLEEDEVRTPFSSSVCAGMDYNAVWSELQKSGFTNIVLNALEDLPFNHTEGNGQVESVLINGSSYFEKFDIFKISSRVRINYHSIPVEKFISAGNSSDEFLEMRSEQAVSLLQSAGFLDITTNLVEDLVNSSEIVPGMVTEIVIGTKSNFSATEEFSNYDKVVITEHRKKPFTTISIPVSSKDCKNKTYDLIQGRLEDAGFTEVKLISEVDDSLFSKAGEIRSITINGFSVWEKGDVFDSTANITIRYCVKTKDVEEETESESLTDESGMIYVSESAKSYKGQNFEVVATRLRDAGFTNVICEPVEDLRSDRNVGKIESISIAGNATFEKNTPFPEDAAVRITYHALIPDPEIIVDEGFILMPQASGKYKGENYEEVTESLSGLGFVNVVSVPTEDLVNGVIHKEYSVKSVSIGGVDSFKENDQFPADAEIIVMYYSFKEKEDPEQSVESPEEVPGEETAPEENKEEGGSSTPLDIISETLENAYESVIGIFN